MKSHLGEKAISRRRFVKTATSSIVAAPLLASSAIAAQEKSGNSAPQSETQSSSTAAPIQTLDILSQHDIPPPLMLSEGSLDIEIDEELTATHVPATPTTPARWHYTKTGALSGIGHIRILQGNGEIVYQDLELEGPHTIIINLDNDGTGASVTGDITIQGSLVTPAGTVFRIESSTNLRTPVNHGPHAQSKKRRRFKFSHPGPQAGGRPFRIASIEVKDSAGTKFKVKAREADPLKKRFSEEYRILVWLH